MMHRTTRSAVAAAYAALQAGRFAEARDAAAPWTTDPAARLLHALGQGGSGEADQAIETLEAIARANPTARHPVHDLVALLHRAGRPEDAAAPLRAALVHRPGDPELLTALGAALSEHGTAAAMLTAFEQAAGAAPGAAAWSNLGKARAASGDVDGADAAFAQARRLAQDDPQLRLNHAVTLLRTGALVSAWPLFRARHALPGRALAPQGPELMSLDGLAGRRLVLLHDEGFGDTIQFIRYASMLAARGAQVAVHVPAPLRRLLAGNGFALADGTSGFEAWCRITDLPFVFGTTMETIPAVVPYLAADARLAASWAARLPPGRRVGLVWAGAARTHDPVAVAMDRLRSIALRHLDPLLAVPGITWISLQRGAPAPPGVFDPMPAVVDFADTAAVIAGLDLVVSVDTAVAHLAAAMGRTVLLLDRYDNCWRWLSGRTDSPWYPGAVRIIRQEQPGDWRSVVARAADALRA